MRRQAKALLVVAALCSFFAIGAAPAFAAKTVVNTIGGESTGVLGGQFSAPRGIAVNQTGNGAPAGTFYVVDGGNNRIQQFGPTGNFIRTWGYGVKDGALEFEVCTVAASCMKGTNNPGAGALNVPVGIAVAPATGHVYVSSQSSRRIDVYSPSGVFQGGFGWGVRTGAAELQFCTTLTGCQAPAAAAPTTGNVGGGQFGTQMGGLAIAPSGDIYFANKSSRRVDVFRPVFSGNIVTGVEFLRSFGWGAATGADAFEVCTASPCKAPAAAGTGLGQFATNSPTEVSLDSAGNVFALDAGNKRVQVFDSTPAPVTSSFGAAALTGAFETGTLQTLTISPETDNVLVSGQRVSAENRVAVLEMTPAGAAVETQGTDLLPTASAGLAAAKPSIGGNVYLTSNNNGHRVYILNETTPTISAPTAIGAHEATFHGTVVSNNLETTFHFEYSTNGTTWTKVPVPDAVAGTTAGTIPVSQVATGLLADTEYQVRLVANRPNGGGATTSAAIAFTTDAMKPTIEDTFAAAVGDTAAGLAAYLNPENDETSFQFEYGPTEAYGSFSPATAAYAGKGTSRVTVAREITGLQPSTTYHFRVLATNSEGTTIGPDRTFTTLPSAQPPAGRAYEMMTPPDKHGSDVLVPGHNEYNGADFTPIVAADGNGLAFTSYGSFAGAKSHGVFSNYLAHRSANGWSTENISPPMNGFEYSSPFMTIESLSDDLGTRVVLGVANPQLNPEASDGTYNNFLWDEETQSYKWLSRGTPPKTFASIQFAGASDDYDHVALLVNDAGAMKLTEDTPPGVGQALYRWDAETEALTYVGKEPVTNVPFAEDTLIADQDVVSGRGATPTLWNSVSDDASKVFFYVGAERSLYVRINNATTQYVSASQAAAPDPNGTRPPTFRFASTDGEVAFFSSAEKLTDDATTGPASTGEDLYRYDVASEELTDITVDAVDANGAEMQGVLGGSDAGDRLYFVAKGVLASGGVAGANNLYLWSDDGSPKGTIEFVSTGVGPENWLGLKAFEYRHMGRVTPDGEHVLFQSTSKLSSYENNGKYEVYVYDADRGAVQCASCPMTGKPATSDAFALGAGDDIQSARTLSDDGRLAFFSTADGLVADDVNGREDAYMFNTQTGRVALVSPGTGAFDAMFLDADADGSDVVFGTRQQLVRIDVDDNMDAYDARVGGGIASQNPPLIAPCVGEACRPEALAPPPVTNSGSSSMQGKGNQKPNRKKPAKKKPKKQQKKGKKKQGKGKAKKAKQRQGNRDGRQG